MATSSSKGHPIEFDYNISDSWRWSDNNKPIDDERPCKYCGKVAVDMLVPVPAPMSHNLQAGWRVKSIDACLAPIVKALNHGGVFTAHCCCGHGKGSSVIKLQDGRSLIIKKEKLK